MKILVVLSRYPWPLDKGDKLRAYYQLRELSRNHEVHLVAATQESLPDRQDNALSFCSSVTAVRLSRSHILKNLLLNIFSGKPYQTAFFYSDKMAEKISELRKKIQPDVVYFQLVRTAEYAAADPEGQAIDYMDTLSAGMEKQSRYGKPLIRSLMRIESGRLKNYEREVFGKFSAHCIISQRDLDQLDLPDKEKFYIIPNGIDFSLLEKSRGYRSQGHLLFHGNMNYPPNEQAAMILAKQILPLVQEANPGLKLVISGASPSAMVRNLESDSVKVTGWIDNLTEVFNDAAVFVAPFRMGTGMQNKLLEAMAAGIPVVTTREPAEAIGAEHNIHLLIADTPEEFRRSVQEIITNKILAENLIAEAKILIQSMTWAKHGLLLEEMLEKARLR